MFGWQTAEQATNSINQSMSSVSESMSPSGVVAVGVESTGVFTVAGEKGAIGLYHDFNTGESGTFAKSGIQLTGHGNDLAGGMELQAAITFDYSDSIGNFQGVSIESGGSLGPIGIDYSITEGKGITSKGFDFGAGGGASVIIVETAVIPFKEQ
ncbi:hypothetical protein I6M53_04020 [Shewanella algae]|uniref:hypothetical protein n=1 Tax=Shewanella algae TaxID=38313 RepID=UPI001AACA379|nr:hypothetical protein [Shewanella algae]MBO2673826.1 hypothetical protein [Shewanella algae]